MVAKWPLQRWMPWLRKTWRKDTCRMVTIHSSCGHFDVRVVEIVSFNELDFAIFWDIFGHSTIPG